jgi:hypothetical protein
MSFPGRLQQLQHGSDKNGRVDTQFVPPQDSRTTRVEHYYEQGVLPRAEADGGPNGRVGLEPVRDGDGMFTPHP